MFISVVLNGFIFFSDVLLFDKRYFVKVYKKNVFFSVSRHFFKKYFKNLFIKGLFSKFMFVPYKFSLFLYFYLFVL